MSDTRKSILQMAKGAIEERVDYEVNRVVDNILDQNTKATGKRKIVLTIEFVPDDAREMIGVSVTAKSTLQATNPVTTSLCITSDYNGVTQRVEARQGIALNSMVEVKPRVSLQPFRTFLEVAQPESEFLLRVEKNNGIGFFEADGGVWKLEAKRNVAAYFDAALKDLVEDGKVVVMM